MKGKIGFIKTDYDVTEMENNTNTVKLENFARKSVVQIYFPDRDRSYAYYNDQFDLKWNNKCFYAPFAFIEYNI